jgi:hypothetical protein
MSLSINIGRPFLNDKTLDEQARSILRKFGTDAHVYLPGANGVAIGGLNSGNYVESTFNTLASVDSVVGGVRDPIGSIDATQATTANKPALRRGLYNLLLNSATPATQSVTCAAAPYTLALYGTGSVTLSGTGSGTLNGTGASDLVVLNFTPTAGSVTFTKSGTVSSFGLFQGTLTAAQILSEGGIPATTSAAASNQSAGRYWWDTAGSKKLDSAPILSEIGDLAIICAGGSSAAGATYPYMLSLGRGAVCQIGSIVNAAGTLQFRFKDDSSTTLTLSLDAAYTGSVIVMSARCSGDTIIARKNGVQTASGARPPGVCTPTVGNIGYDSGSGSSWAGQIGPVIVIKGTISDSDLLTLERWVAANTLGAPSF